MEGIGQLICKAQATEFGGNCDATDVVQDRQVSSFGGLLLG